MNSGNENAVQTLALADRLFPLLLSGEKTSTIRWREQPVVIGPLTFICVEEQSNTADVIVSRCTTMPLRDAPSFLNYGDEWSGDVMLNGMKEHYPDIELKSIVQVIEFRLSNSR